MVIEDQRGLEKGGETVLNIMNLSLFIAVTHTTSANVK